MKVARNLPVKKERLCRGLEYQNGKQKNLNCPILFESTFSRLQVLSYTTSSVRSIVL